MCKALEEYTQSRFLEGKIEGKIEDIKKMLKDGLSLEKALKYTGIDEETYKKYMQ